MNLIVDVLVAVVSGLIVLGIQLSVQRFGSWSTPDLPPTQSAGGSLVTVGGDVRGDVISIDASDRTHTTNLTNVTNNFRTSSSGSHAAGTTEDADEWGKFILTGVCLVVGVVVFVANYAYVVAVFCGVGGALLLSAGFALRRTARLFGLSRPASVATVDVLVAVLSAAIVVVGIFTTTRGGLSVAHLRTLDKPQGATFLDWVLNAFTNQLNWLIDGAGDQAAVFGATFFLAAVLSSALLWSAVRTMFGWKAYLALATSTTSNATVLDRAERFRVKPWHRLLGNVLTLAFIVVTSRGVTFDFLRAALDR
jgi:hypothetical protein